MVALVILFALLCSSVLVFGSILIVFAVRIWLERSAPEFLLFAFGIVIVGYVLCGLCIAAIYKVLGSDSYKNAFLEYLKLVRFLPKALLYILWFGGGAALMIFPLICLADFFGGRGIDLRAFIVTIFFAAVWLLLTMLFFKLRKKRRFGRKKLTIPAGKDIGYIYAAFPVFRAHGAYKYHKGKTYAVCVTAAAYYNTEDSLLTEKITPVYWGTKRLDIPKNLQEAGFAGEGVYSLKVRALADGSEGFLLEKVLGKKTDCKPLDEIFGKYYNASLPVSRMFGEMTLDRQHEILCGEVCIKDGTADIEIAIDFFKPETWQEIVDKAERYFGDLKEFDDKCREYILQELYDNVDEWNDDEEPAAPITKERFLERLSSFEHINIDDDGFEMWYDPNGMFTDHSILVTGSYEKGFEDANLEG